MKYKVIRSDLAEQDLMSIVNYIADDSKNIDVALNYLDKLERPIMKLSDFPYMGVIPRYKSIRIQGFRVLIVESHLVFYKIDESVKQVIVYRIFHSKQDYQNLI